MGRENREELRFLLEQLTNDSAGSLGEIGKAGGSAGKHVGNGPGVGMSSQAAPRWALVGHLHQTQTSLEEPGLELNSAEQFRSSSVCLSVSFWGGCPSAAGFGICPVRPREKRGFGPVLADSIAAPNPVWEEWTQARKTPKAAAQGLAWALG